MKKNSMYLLLLILVFSCSKSTNEPDDGDKINKLEFVWTKCLDTNCTETIEMSTDSCPANRPPRLKLTYYEGIDTNDKINFYIVNANVDTVFAEYYKYISGTDKFVHYSKYLRSPKGTYFGSAIVIKNGSIVWSGKDTIVVY